MGARLQGADIVRLGVLARIPAALRTFTDGQDEVLVEASNVGVLLSRLDEAFPGLRDRIVDETGSLRPYVNVFVNDDLTRERPEEIPLRAGDVVHILPSIAGGLDG